MEIAKNQGQISQKAYNELKSNIVNETQIKQAVQQARERKQAQQIQVVQQSREVYGPYNSERPVYGPPTPSANKYEPPTKTYGPYNYERYREPRSTSPEIKEFAVQSKGGTIIAGSNKKTVELSKYENSEYNKYLRGQQSYQDYTKNVNQKVTELNRSFVVANKTPSKNFLQRSDEAYYRADKVGSEKNAFLRFSDPSSKGSFGATNKKGITTNIKRTAAQFEAIQYGFEYGIREGSKNAIKYAKDNPFETAAFVGVALAPELLPAKGGRILSVSKKGIKGFQTGLFGAFGTQYAYEGILRVQEADTYGKKSEVFGNIAGETGTTLLAFKTIEKAPSFIAKSLKTARSEFNTMLLKEQLKGKYDNALVTTFSQEVKTIPKDVSVNLLVEPITGLKGQQTRYSMPTRQEEVFFGKVEPVFGEKFFASYDALKNAPKDFVADVTVVRSGSFVPFSQPKMFLNPTLPSTKRAQKIQTTERYGALFNVKDVGKFSKPLVRFGRSKYYGGFRIAQASTLEASFRPIELSSEMGLSTKNKSGRKSKRKYKENLSVGDIAQSKQKGIERYVRSGQPSIQPSLGKLFQRYVSEPSGQTFVQKFDLPKEYANPLIIRKVEVKAKRSVKDLFKAKASEPVNRGGFVATTSGGSILLQKMERQKQETRQKSMMANLKQNRLNQRQRTSLFSSRSQKTRPSQKNFYKQQFYPTQKRETRQKKGVFTILSMSQKQKSSQTQQLRQREGVLTIPRFSFALKNSLKVEQKRKQDTRTAFRTKQDTLLGLTPSSITGRGRGREKPKRETPPDITFGLPDLPKRYSSKKKKKGGFGLLKSPSRKYTPTIYASFGGIKGKRTKADEITGLGIRPIG